MTRSSALNPIFRSCRLIRRDALERRNRNHGWGSGRPIRVHRISPAGLSHSVEIQECSCNRIWIKSFGSSTSCGSQAVSQLRVFH